MPTTTTDWGQGNQVHSPIPLFPANGGGLLGLDRVVLEVSPLRRVRSAARLPSLGGRSQAQWLAASAGDGAGGSGGVLESASQRAGRVGTATAVNLHATGVRFTRETGANPDQTPGLSGPQSVAQAVLKSVGSTGSHDTRPTARGWPRAVRTLENARRPAPRQNRRRPGTHKTERWGSLGLH
jgi:hypothetical protein